MGPGIRVDVPAVLAAAQRPSAATARRRRPRHTRSRHATRRHNRRSTDRRRQPAPADRDARGRDGRGLIRRTGSAPSSPGDAGEHAEAGPVPHLRGGQRPCSRAPPDARRRDVDGASAPARHRRAPAARRKEAPCRPRPSERRSPSCSEELSAQPDADRLRLPRPDRHGDRRDPPQPAQAGHDAIASSRTASARSPPQDTPARRARRRCSTARRPSPSAHDEVGDREGASSTRRARTARSRPRRRARRSARSTPTA